MLGRTVKVLLILGVALVAAGAVTTAAAGDGLPVLGVDVGAKGVAARLSPVRYVTLPAGRDTLVARTALDGGRVLSSARLPGNFTIPAVAYDGSASGLSADGSTLVLIQPRTTFPRAETRLAILDANRLHLRKVVTLSGDYSFDAISPDGATLFLIQYTSPGDPTQYNVRAYDVRSGRLVREPVVDPRERDEVMRGNPISRVMSPDGRFAYTLYDGAGGAKPFVHALDTSKREARCIDLTMLAGRQDVWGMRLTRTADGSRLNVGTTTRTLAVVDTKDFRVSAPADNPAAGGHSWLLLAMAALTAVLAASVLSVTLGRAWKRRKRASVVVAPQ